MKQYKILFLLISLLCLPLSLVAYEVKITFEDNRGGYFTFPNIEGEFVLDESIIGIHNCSYFVKWDDGNTDFPRTIDVTQDTALTLITANKEVKIITQPNDTAAGKTGGDGIYECGNTELIDVTPNPHYHFSHWELDGQVIDLELYRTNNSTSTYRLKVEGENGEEKTYIAHFIIDTISVTVYAEDESIGFVEQEHHDNNTEKHNPAFYPWGTENITITAIAASDCYKFDYWTDSEGNKFLDNPYILPKIETDVEYTAHFVAKKVLLTINYDAGADINVSAKDSDGTELTTIVGEAEIQIEADCGSDVELAISVDGCFVFDGWDIDNDGLLDLSIEDSTQTTITHTIEGNKTLTLKLRRKKVYVKFLTDNIEQGTGYGIGPVSEKWYECGSMVQLANEPKPCYEFDYWLAGSNPQKIRPEGDEMFGPITQDTVFTCYFKEKSFSVDFRSNDDQMGQVMAVLNNSTNEEISSPYTNLHCGDSFTLIPIAKDGYLFSGWEDGSKDSLRTIVMDNDTPNEFIAIFVPKIILTLKAQTQDGALFDGAEMQDVVALQGTILPASKDNPWSWYCTEGAVVEFSAVSTDDCYMFSKWSDGESDSKRRITIAENAEYIAVFKEDTIHINVNGTDAETGEILYRSVMAINCSNPEQRFYLDFAGKCYGFERWLDGDFSEDRLLTIEDFQSDTTLTIYYTHKYVTISVDNDNPQFGTVLINGSEEMTITEKCGATVTIEAHSTDACYEFKGWNDDNKDSVRIITIDNDQDETYTAYFGKKEYKLNIAFSPTGIDIDATLVSDADIIVGENLFECGSVIKDLTLSVSDACYRFVGWSDGETGLTHPEININHDISLTAIFDNTYSNISFGTNSECGSVEAMCGDKTYTSSLPTLRCGDSFILSAIESDNCKFVKWIDNNSTDKKRTIIVDTNTPTYFEALFAKCYEITLETEPIGAATIVTDKPMYEYGETAVVGFIENSCYDFISWADGATDLTRTIVVHQDTTIKAIFKQKQYTLSTNTTDPIKGSVSAGGTYGCGTEVTITATPNASYRFDHWLEDGSKTNPRQVIIDSDMEFTAVFVDDIYTLTVELAGIKNGATVLRGPGTYYGGTDVTVEILTEGCYEIYSWNDDSTTTANIRNIHLTSDSTIVATIAVHMNTCTIMFEPLEAGEPIVEQKKCGEGYFVRTPAISGWKFLHWEDGTVNVRYVTNEAAEQNQVFTAYMERLNYNVSVTCDPMHGTVTGSGVYEYGTVLTLVATPNQGYEFVRWSDGYDNPEYRITVTKDIILTAEFRPIPYTIYVIYNDTVCAGEDYVLPSGEIVPYMSEVRTITDVITDFEYDTDKFCDRIFTITLYPAVSMPQPIIGILPTAIEGKELSLDAATTDALNNYYAAADALTPTLTDYYWEVLDETTGEYTRYNKWICSSAEQITLRFVVENNCEIKFSKAVTIPVEIGQNDEFCYSVVYLSTDKDTTGISIDTERMFHLGYNFAADNVDWYRVVDTKDGLSITDDEFIASGFELQLLKLALPTGEYYARIALTEPQDILTCDETLISEVMVYDLQPTDEFVLVPNRLKNGETLTLLGLQQDDVATITIFDLTGKLLLQTEVEQTTYFDFNPIGEQGMYIFRVQTQDRKQTLKYILE